MVEPRVVSWAEVALDHLALLLGEPPERLATRRTALLEDARMWPLALLDRRSRPEAAAVVAPVAQCARLISRLVWRPHGLERALDALIEHIATRAPDDAIRLMVPPRDFTLGRALAARGFQQSGAWLNKVRPAAPVPADTRPLATGRPGPDFVTLSNRCFEGIHGNIPLHRAGWERMRQSPLFDPALTLVHREEGEPLGFVRGALVGTVGRIEAVGVVPAARGRGLGKALLRAGVRRLQRRGAQQVELRVWSGNGPARSIYRGEGFVARAVLPEWERAPDRPEDSG